MKKTGKIKQKHRKETKDARRRKRSVRQRRLPDYEPSGIELTLAAAGLIGRMK